jgi:hypothetical protein
MSSDKLPRVLVSKSEQLNINSSDVKSMSIVHKQDAVMVTDEAFAVPNAINIQKTQNMSVIVH